MSPEGVVMFSKKASKPGTSNPRNMKLAQNARRIIGVLIVRNMVTPSKLASSYMERRKLSLVYQN